MGLFLRNILYFNLKPLVRSIIQKVDHNARLDSYLLINKV